MLIHRRRQASVEMEGKAVAALLLLLAVLLVLQAPRELADHLSIGGSALSDLVAAWSQLLDLLTRRNMILLCNAILFIVLRDAGLLASPARCNGTSSSSSSVTAAAASPVATSASSRTRRRRARNAVVVVWCRSKAAAGAGAADHVDGSDVVHSSLEHRLQRPEPTPCVLPMEAETQSSPGEIAMAEGKGSSCSDSATTTATMAPRALPPAGVPKQSSGCLDDSDDNAAVGEVAMADDQESSLCSDPDHSAGADTDVGDDAEAPDQFGEDVDDMNRRFEEFIANTRRKMQLESLQLVLKV